jgi:sialic acid synthase SpsE
MTLDSDLPQFRAGEPWNEKLYSLYEKTAMPYEWIPELQRVAEQFGIELFPSVFDLDSLEKAELLNMPRYKIASFEINDLNLIDAVARTSKPIILSTGTATEQEIRDAIHTVQKYHNDITLLKCTSKYPAKLEELNLATIPDMQVRYGCKIGFSDHTTGVFAAPIAVAIGAEVIEKHICLDNSGPDGSFSLTPPQFSGMVELVRRAETCVGKVSYDTPKTYRRSMVATEQIKKGECTEWKMKSLRSTITGTMTPEMTATKNYNVGDLIKGNKNEQVKCTDNRRNG